jgi:hypothetical protein
VLSVIIALGAVLPWASDAEPDPSARLVLDPITLTYPVATEVPAAIFYSPDGTKLFATPAGRHPGVIMDLSTGKELLRIEADFASDRALTYAVFTRDSASLLIPDYRLTGLDSISGKPEDRRRVYRGEIIRWDLKAGVESARWPLPVGHGAAGITVLADGRTLISHELCDDTLDGSRQLALALWDLEGRRRPFLKRSGEVYFAARAGVLVIGPPSQGTPRLETYALDSLKRQHVWRFPGEAAPGQVSSQIHALTEDESTVLSLFWDDRVKTTKLRAHRRSDLAEIGSVTIPARGGYGWGLFRLSESRQLLGLIEGNRLTIHRVAEGLPALRQVSLPDDFDRDVFESVHSIGEFARLAVLTRAEAGRRRALILDGSTGRVLETVQLEDGSERFTLSDDRRYLATASPGHVRVRRINLPR